MTKFLLRTAVVLIVICFAPSWSSADSETRGSATIIFVRHAEKSGPKGDVPLSAEGRERAELLAWMVTPSGLTHLFSSHLQRARETAAAVERATQLKAEVIAAEEDKTLVERLKNLPDQAVALVVSHSSLIPKLVENLGAGKIAPIAEEDYDRFVVVVRIADQYHAASFQYRHPSAPALKQ